MICVDVGNVASVTLLTYGRKESADGRRFLEVSILMQNFHQTAIKVFDISVPGYPISCP